MAPRDFGHVLHKSLYRAIAATPAPEPFQLIWKIRLPLKIRIFMWQWIRGRVPSGMEALKRNGSVDGLCPLCGTAEDSNHIFFSLRVRSVPLDLPSRDHWGVLV